MQAGAFAAWVRMAAMRCSAALLLVLALCGFAAADSDPFAGTFRREQVTLQLSGTNGEYSGSITVQGRKYPVTAKTNGETASGSFEIEGHAYAITLTPYATGLKLTAEGLEYKLERVAPGSTDPKDAPKAGAAQVQRVQAVQGHE